MPAPHETQRVHGVSDMCLYNDHSECDTRGCRCDCHSAKVAQPVQPQTQSRLANIPVSLTQTEKFCPQCQVRYDETRQFCTKDGRRLSSLRCPECGNVADISDIFCGYCGRKLAPGEDQILESGGTVDAELEAAAMGPVTSNKLQSGMFK